MLFRWIQPYGFYQPSVTCVISRSWAEKEGFSESHKTLLKIQQGDSQVFPYTGLDRLPNATQAKPATASLLLNRQQLDRLPSTHRRWDSDSSARWWLLENCLPANTDDETPTHYWIHETLSKLQPLTPWHWVGYTCLDEQRRPLEHLLSQLYHHRETPLTQLQHLLQSNSWLGATLSNAQKMLPVGLDVNTLRELFEHSHQLKHYLPRLNSVEPGDLQQHLLGLLDKNKDRWLSPEKIGQAQQKPWLQQRLASLAIKTHSEWHWNANKWKALDGLANHTCNSPNPQWAAQKELIEQLCWWKDVAVETELKADGLIWTLHPIRLVSQLQQHSRVHPLTEADMRVLWTGVTPNTERYDFMLAVLEEINANLERYKLDTPERQAHFLGQMRQETGSTLSVEENLNFSIEALIGTFSVFNAVKDGEEVGRAVAERIGRDDSVNPIRRANEEAIANYAYADTWEHFEGFPAGGGRRVDLRLGNTEPTDGWDYRGRGMKQLTGRNNYTNFNRDYPRMWPDDLDPPNFIEHPDLLLQPLYATRSGVYFWLKNELYLIADEGVNPDVINRVTNVINGGEDDDRRSDRVAFVERIYEHLIRQPGR